MNSSVPAQIAAVEQLLADTQQVELWLDGGWGVDALLRRQTRSHSDIDVIVAKQDLAALVELLTSISYTQTNAEGCVYQSPAGTLVDIHCVDFDENGYGHFPLDNGTTWPLPPSAFRGRGVVGSTKVMCLSAEAQVHCHTQGYNLTETDRADLQALQEAFEVVLPLSFYA